MCDSFVWLCNHRSWEIKIIQFYQTGVFKIADYWTIPYHLPEPHFIGPTWHFFWKASEIFDINHWKNLLCWNHLCGNSSKIIMVIFSPWGNLNIVTLSIMANAFQRQWSRWENVLHDCFKNMKYIEGILEKLKTSIQPWALFSWISAKLFVHRKYIQLF